MEHDITLKWRPGTQHQLPDAMSRLPNKSIVIEDFDDFFPGNESLPNVHKGPQGPVLDGVHLETLGMEDVDGYSTQSLTVLAAVALTPEDLSEADTQQAKLVIAPELPVVVMLDCGGGRQNPCIRGIADGHRSSRSGLESTGMHQSKWTGQRCEATWGDNRVAGMPNYVERGETRRGGL